MHLSVVLRNRLDVVVPALLFATKAPFFQLPKPVLLHSVSRSHPSTCSRLVVEETTTHERATVLRLRQLHGVELRAQEGNLCCLADSARNVIDDLVSVRLVLLQDEGCCVLAALEFGVEGATAWLVPPVEALEASIRPTC